MAREIEQHIHNNTLTVIVKANAKKTEVIGYDSAHQRLRIAISAPALDGRANITLLRYLKKQTGRACTIKTGKTSRKKTILFTE